MSSHNPLTLLRRLDTTSPTFHDQVSNILYGEEYIRWVPDLQGEDLMELVDYLDKVGRRFSLLRSLLNLHQALNSLDPTIPTFQKCLRELRNICGSKMILPTSYMVSSKLLDISSRPVTSGSSADVYEGTLKNSKVCVKRIRIYSYRKSQIGPEKVFVLSLLQNAIDDGSNRPFAKRQ